PVVVSPDARDVAEVRVIGHGLIQADPKKKIDLKLTRKGQLEPVLDWLKAIDWDKSKAQDITQLRIVAQLIILGEIVITKKDKTTLRFELQPTYVIEGNNRWKADVKTLDAAIKKAR